MSYRSFKRVLGETNFEVKCLVLFGAGLTLLGVITSTLFWWQTSALVEEQNRTTARILMAPNILQRHRQWLTNLTLNLSEKHNRAAYANPPDENGEDGPPAEQDGQAPDRVEQPDTPPDEFKDLRKQVEAIRQSLQPEKLKDYKFELSVATAGSADADSDDRPDNIGYFALQELLGGKDEYIHSDTARAGYQYYCHVRAQTSCL